MARIPIMHPDDPVAQYHYEKGFLAGWDFGGNLLSPLEKIASLFLQRPKPHKNSPSHKLTLDQKMVLDR